MTVYCANTADLTVTKVKGVKGFNEGWNEVAFEDGTRCKKHSSTHGPNEYDHFTNRADAVKWLVNRFRSWHSLNETAASHSRRRLDEAIKKFG